MVSVRGFPRQPFRGDEELHGKKVALSAFFCFIRTGYFTKQKTTNHWKQSFQHKREDEREKFPE